MIEIKLLPNSEVEIIGEISAEIFMSGRSEALKELAETVSIDGFRKGKAPENVLISHAGNDALLEKMAVIALEKAYPKIINEHKIMAIGRPEISITKMAENNPLGFRVKTAVLPEVKLPDYKNIAQKIIGGKKEAPAVEEKEIDHALEHIRKPRAKKNDKGEEILPELNDDFAKSVGKFENMEALRKTIKENILAEKKMKEKESNRSAFLEKIAEAVDEEMPKVMIENEKDKMLEEMKHNMTSMGLKWEDYLAHIKKTEEELRTDWEKDAVKRVKFGLILEKIAETEKIEVPAEELEKEASAMIDYQKGMGRELDKERVKNYLYGVIKNEKVFKMLEG